MTDAMARTIGQVPFHGLRFEGKRFDCGNKAGYLEAIEHFGGTVTVDTCILTTPMLPPEMAVLIPPPCSGISSPSCRGRY